MLLCTMFFLPTSNLMEVDKITKKTFLVLIGLLIIFSTPLVSLWLVNPIFETSNNSILEPEDQSPSSSVFSYLRDGGVPLDTFMGETKEIHLPFSGFIQNLGQLRDDSILFYYSTNGLSVGFGPSTVVFAYRSQEDLEPVNFFLKFPGAQTVVPIGREKKNHYVNYFYSDFQVTNVPTWDEVWYEGLYPGIDLRYYMSSQGLKYDFVVHPGVDPTQIAIQVSESMKLSIEEQEVTIQPSTQPEGLYLQDTSLKVYQEDETTISARFYRKLTPTNCYGFRIGRFDSTQTLIIDPLVLAFSTFLGGNNLDAGFGIATDANGNSYVTGWTESTNFPTTTGALNETYNGGNTDVFVTKINATGNELIFSTYVGGSDEDHGHGIAVDTAGSTYVTGTTESSNFPMKNAYNDTYGGSKDVFVLKLNAAGNDIDFSTYLGGNYGDSVGRESAKAGSDMIAIDVDGNCYITGYTQSSNFPTTPNAYNTTLGGNFDAFVTKLNVTGGLNFSTFLGGSDQELGLGIAVDTSGNSYITGYTLSTDFPTKNAYQSTHAGGLEDVFVTKLNATGNGLNFSTYLGGFGAVSFTGDRGYAIAVDSTGNSYVTGVTGANDFPRFNAYQNSKSGGTDAFITKFNATGNGLNFSTFLGGSNDEAAEGIELDTEGNSYVTGYTLSNDFPMQNAYNSTYGGNNDVFITKLNATGNGLNFSTYLGGSADDKGLGIAIDSSGNSYITGITNSSNFPMLNGYNETYGGNDDGFVAKLWMDNIAPSINLVSPGNNSIKPSNTLIDLNIADENSGISQVLYNWDGNPNGTLTDPYDVFLPTGDGQHILRVYANDSTNNWAGATFVFTTDDIPPSIILSSPVNGSTHQSGMTIDLTITGSNTTFIYHWDTDPNSTVAATFDPTLPGGDGLHRLYIYVSDFAGNWNTSYFEFFADNTPPSIILSSPVNGSTHQSGMTIDLTILGSNGSLIYHWDTDPNSTVAATFDPTLPGGDGLHRLYVYVKDAVGNWNTSYFEFFADNTPPSIILSSPVNGTTHQSGMTIDLTITGSNGSLIYHWDTDLNSTELATFDPTLPGGDGLHRLYVYVKDAVG
ncbi:MAG: SBBP repeat-containing protein, partial [Promethearchaeota archaeon]